MSTPVEPEPTEPAGKPWWRRKWAIVAIVVIGLAGLGALVGEEESEETDVVETSTSEVPSEPPTPTPTPTPTPVETEPDGCNEAFAAEAALSDMEDTYAELFPAIEQCADVAAWNAAAAANPGAIDADVDAETVLANLCQRDEVDGDEQLCEQALNPASTASTVSEPDTPTPTPTPTPTLAPTTPTPTPTVDGVADTPEMDASATLACSHFVNVMDDVGAGILTTGEIREKISEVYDNARLAEQPAELPGTSQRLLAAVTADDGEAFVEEVVAMYDLCEAS